MLRVDVFVKKIQSDVTKSLAFSITEALISGFSKVDSIINLLFFITSSESVIFIF